MRRLKLNPHSQAGNRTILHENLHETEFFKNVVNNINGVPPQFPESALAASSPHILIACMPKSASTYLTVLVEEYLAFDNVPLCFDFGSSEQDLYLPNLLYFNADSTVSQHHLRATEANLKMINTFDIKTVLVVRDIGDALVSLRDQVTKSIPENLTAKIPDDFADWSTDRQMDLIIDFAGPWFVQFFVTWWHASAKGKVSPLWINYENLTRDPVEELLRIAAFVGVPSDPATARAAVQRSEARFTRYNKGVSGRGMNTLSLRQILRLRRLIRNYDDVNFRMIAQPYSRPLLSILADFAVGRLRQLFLRRQK